MGLTEEVMTDILFDKWKTKGDKYALEKIYKLVEDMCFKMVQDSIQGNEFHPLFEQFMSVANEAVVKAARDYDKSHGTKWSTYCYHKIRSAINHEHARTHRVKNNLTVANTSSVEDEDQEEWLARLDPVTFEEDLDVQWILEDFFRTANLGSIQKEVVLMTFQGLSVDDITYQTGLNRDLMYRWKKTIEEKYVQYLEDSKKIYKKQEELILE